MRAMRAVLIEQFGAPPRVTEVAAPEPPADGVVVAVEATGLCRSDWHAWAGHDRSIVLPHVPGHEFVGKVVARGDQVERIRVGQRILTPFVCGCGTCPQCRAGDSQVCPHQTQPGFTHWGSFAEQVVVRHADHNALLVAEEADVADLVGLGCRFATSFRGLHHRARLRSGETLAVFGCGGVGLSAVMIGQALGAEVVAVDVTTGALDLARRAGADHVVNAAGLEPAEVASHLRARWPGVAVTVDALGSQTTATSALLSLAPRGRHVQIGLFAEEPVLPIGRVVAQELSLLGSHGMPAVDYPEMLDLIQSGSLHPGSLVTRRITLEQAPDALVSMDSAPPVGMTLIEP